MEFHTLWDTALALVESRAIASNPILKRMKTMILGSFSRRHGGHGAGELNCRGFRMGGLRKIWRGCLSRRHGGHGVGELNCRDFRMGA